MVEQVDVSKDKVGEEKKIEEDINVKLETLWANYDDIDVSKIIEGKIGIRGKEF